MGSQETVGETSDMTMVEKKPFVVVIGWRLDRPDVVLGFNTMESAEQMFEGLQKAMETNDVLIVHFDDARIALRGADILHLVVSPS